MQALARQRHAAGHNHKRADQTVPQAGPGYAQARGNGKYKVRAVKNKGYQKSRDVTQVKRNPHERDERPVQPCHKPDDKKQHRTQQ